MELKTATEARVAIATLGVRVTDIARLAGLSQPYMSQILRGRRSYTPILRIRVERAISEAAKQVPNDDERPRGLIRIPASASARPMPVPRIRRL